MPKPFEKLRKQSAPRLPARAPPGCPPRPHRLRHNHVSIGLEQAARTGQWTVMGEERKKDFALYSLLWLPAAPVRLLFNAPGQTHCGRPQALTTPQPHSAPPCRGGARRTRTHDSGLNLKKKKRHRSRVGHVTAFFSLLGVHLG